MQSKSVLKTNAVLWLLSLGNFVVGMGAFMVIGILSPIAQDLGITKAQAGLLMTFYAVSYAVSSPLLMALSGRIERAKVLMVGMGLFAFGALLAFFANDLDALLWSRMVMALGAGIVTPVAASLGVAMSDASARGKALAVVFGGLTLAQALGVPVGAWLGYTFGWHTAFAVVFVFGAITVAAFYRGLPQGVVMPVASLPALWAVLSNYRESLAVSFTAFFIGALYVFYTFMAPFLEARYQLSRDGITLILAIFGAGAVFGNSLGGWMTDRIGTQRTLVCLCAAQVVLLPALTYLTLPLNWFAVLVGVWSVCCWSFMVPQQARLAALSPQRTPVLLALNASAIYVGGSLGSWLGALVLKQFDFSILGPVAVVLAVLAWLSLFLTRPQPSL